MLAGEASYPQLPDSRGINNRVGGSGVKETGQLMALRRGVPQIAWKWSLESTASHSQQLRVDGVFCRIKFLMNTRELGGIQCDNTRTSETKKP